MPSKSMLGSPPGWPGENTAATLPLQQFFRRRVGVSDVGDPDVASGTPNQRGGKDSAPARMVLPRKRPRKRLGSVLTLQGRRGLWQTVQTFDIL